MNEKILHIKVQEMTEEIMDFLEKKGLIIRLCPSHHRFETEPGTGVGRTIYASSQNLGHKLIIVAIDRDRFSAFGYHDENEEVFLLGGENEKELYMLFGLYSLDVMNAKRNSGALCSDDFICLRCKFNDPRVSFFAVCAGALHGEATGGGGGSSSFYVTEPENIRLDFFDWGNYIAQPI